MLSGDHRIRATRLGSRVFLDDLQIRQVREHEPHLSLRDAAQTIEAPQNAAIRGLDDEKSGLVAPCNLYVQALRDLERSDQARARISGVH